MPNLVYDRAAALVYARAWAFSRNPRYYDFSYLGGDCTNFVSQCLFAGAGVMNYTPNTGWYYVSLQNRASAWTGVVPFGAFLLTNRGAGPYASEASPEQMRVGDIIQLGHGGGAWYHTLFVTRPWPEICVAAHTFDALDRPLQSYGAAVVRCLKIVGIRG